MNSITVPGTQLKAVELTGRASTRIAGGLLANLGVEVTRVTWSGRRAAGDEHPAASDTALKLAWDHRKHLLEVDDESAPALQDAVAVADLLLTSADTGAEEVPFADFAGTHLHITPFGRTGPYRGFRGIELTAASYGGLTPYVGEADRAPLLPPVMVAAQQTGVVAAIAALAASLKAEPQRRLVDLAEFELLATDAMAGLYSLSFFAGPPARRAGHRKPSPYPFTILPCKDGQVCLVFLSGHHWRALVEAMGNPEWASDPRYSDRRKMGELYADEVDALVSEWLRERSKQELLELAIEKDIPLGPLLTVEDLLGYPQLLERGFFKETSGPDGAGVRVPTLPFVQIPASGKAEPTVSRSPSVDPAAGPLAGCRVVDLGWVLSAPMVGQLLADLGADVIKVESLTHLDPSRRGLPLIAGEVEAGDAGLTPNLMPHFNNVNRGKRSIVLNLRTDAGREVLLRLVDRAEVLLENLGAGSLQRLELGPEVLHARRPSLVLVQISMAGQHGAGAGLAGFAPQSTAIAGLDHLCGYEPDAPIGMVGSNLGDVCAATYATAGLLAALRRARATGAGATLDCSMIEANAMHLAPYIVDAQLDEAAEPKPRGNSHARYFPHGVYESAGEDEWVGIAARDGEEWAGLCDLLGLAPELRGIDAAARRERGAEISAAIAAWARQRTALEATDAVQAAGACAAPVLGAEELIYNEHAQAREVVVNLDHHLLGHLPVYGSPFRAEPLLGWVRGRAPDLAEHQGEILAELGFADTDLTRLADGGAFDGVPLSPGDHLKS